MFRTLISLFILSLPMSCFASFKCGNNGIVHEGDSTSIVKITCGPAMDEKYVGEVRINGRKVNVDKWTYNPGYGTFYKILEFHDDRLVSISNGPRVSKSNSLTNLPEMNDSESDE